MKRITSILLMALTSFILLTPVLAQRTYDYYRFDPYDLSGEAILSRIVVASVSQSSTDPSDVITVSVKLSNLNRTYVNGLMVSVGNLSAETLSLTNTFGPFDVTIKSEDSSIISFDLLASPNIKSGNYPLTLSLTYVDSYEEKTVSVIRNISVLIEAKEDKKPSPLIIVSSYDINSDQVYGGDNFDLTFTLKNTSQVADLSNILLNFSSELNAFAPVSGSSNQLYIDRISAGGIYTGKIKLEANSNIGSGFYNLLFGMQYEDDSNRGYTNSAQIGILLEQIEEEMEEEVIPSMYIIPYIVVSAYDIGTDKLFAGDEFELSVTLLNTSSELALSNIMLVYTSMVNAFVPSAGSSNQLHIGEISAGGSHTCKLKLKSHDSLIKGDYILRMELQYQDDYRNLYATSADITLPIEQKQKLSMSIISADETCVLGSRSLLSIAYENPGMSDIKNLVLNLEGDIAEVEKTVEIGTVKAGVSSFIDHYITPRRAGRQDIEVTMSFEDDEGNTYKTETKTVSIMVNEPAKTPVETPQVTPDSTGESDSVNGATFNSLWVYIIVAGVLLAVAAIVIGVVVAMKRKKAVWK